ncbi:unnamed protein product, partial [Mesorhabditis spiculigera]
MSSTSNPDDKGKNGGKWTGCLYFLLADKKWGRLNPDEVSKYFRDELHADEEIILFSEIRKYNLGDEDNQRVWEESGGCDGGRPYPKRPLRSSGGLIPLLKSVAGWFGYWHEYTIVRSTNWYWSFEKNSTGIFVQRSKNLIDVHCYFAGEARKEDRSEGRSSVVAFHENILDVGKWIVNRGELSATYHYTERNCHHFASLLYEAITRTKGNRRLDNTE